MRSMERLELAQETRDLGFVLRAAVAISGVLLFYTSIDLYGSDVWGTPPPSAWTLVFVAAAGLLLLVRPDQRAPPLRPAMMLWIAGFVFLTTLWAVFIKDDSDVMQALVDRYRSIAFLVALAIVFQDRPVRRLAVRALAGAALLAAAVNVAESAGLLTFAPNLARVPGRAGGFYVNANTSGLAITVGFAVAIPRVPQRWRYPLLLAGAAGVALTFSRSSVLAYGVMVAFLVWTRAVHLGRMAGAALLALGVLVYFSTDVRQTLEAAGVLNENTMSRIEMTRDDSGRVEVARRAWALFLASPVVGHGIGATSDWDYGLQTHNMYLLFGADHGILGLLVLPALALALAWRNRAAVPLAAVLLLAGFFSHSLLVERPTLLAIALAAAAGVGGERDEDDPDDAGGAPEDG